MAMAGRADKVSIVLPSAPNWAPAWRHRSRAVSAFAACLLVVGLAPGLSRAQDGDTAARVQKLEAEIANLKVMVGTLESLVRMTPPSALAQDDAGQPAASQDDLGPRVAALETQIGALTNQIEQIGRQMSALQAKLEAAPQADAPPPQAVTPTPQAEAPPPQAEAPPPQAKTPAPQAKTPPPQAKTPSPQAKTPSPQAVTPAPQAETPAPQAKTPSPQAVTPAPQAATPPPAPVIPPDASSADPSKPRWYGPRQGDAADGGPQGIVPPGAATGAAPDAVLQSLAALPDSDAQALYEQGYGDYLQRDYASAEAAFSSLVKDYPDDPLAGGAQYWVGETYYVRKQYKKAADTFLAGYRKYASSDKAPDTLLRLGMSLAALGQKDAACSTFKELGDKFPDAPDHLRNQAKGEAGKAGCK